MRMRPASGFVLFALALLGGCDGAKVPLASSDGASLDQRLTGWWEAVDLEETAMSPASLLVLAFNEHEYYLEYYTQDEDDAPDSTRSPDAGGGDPGFFGALPEPSRFRAYTTPIDGALFANVQCIDCEDHLFILFRYALAEDGLLTVHVVDEAIYKTDFETSEALYAYVKKHGDEEAFYEQIVKFRRLNDGSAHLTK